MMQYGQKCDDDDDDDDTDEDDVVDDDDTIIIFTQFKICLSSYSFLKWVPDTPVIAQVFSNKFNGGSHRR